MYVDAMYLVAVCRIAALHERIAQARLLELACAEGHCGGWRETLGQAFIALGERIAGTRTAPVRRVSGLHWQGER